MDYTAQGHTVGLAARMEQIAQVGSVYLTDNTAKLVSGFFALRDLGRLEVKGAQAPLRIYELTGLGNLRTRLEVSRARGFSRFVGRDGEIAVLQSVLDKALEGRGQIVGIVGEAGEKEPTLPRVRRAVPGAGHLRQRGPLLGPWQDHPLPPGPRALAIPISASA